MTNKYLEKAASLRGFAKNLGKELKDSKALDKIGLGMSAVGLTTSVSRTGLAAEHKKREQDRAALEAKSLQTLEDMSKSLNKRPRVTVTIKQPQTT